MLYSFPTECKLLTILRIKFALLRYQNPEDRIFNCIILDISVVPRDTTPTISDSTETGLPVKSEIVRVVSLIKMEITEIIRFKNRIPDTLNCIGWGIVE